MAAEIDNAPTLVELAGPTPPNSIEFDGVSLAPLLRCEPGWAECRIHSTQHPRFYVDGKRQMNAPQPCGRSAVLDERWRLADGNELYEIDADPAHAHDVAADYPGEVARLRTACDRWSAEVSATVRDRGEIPIGAEGGNPTRLTGFDWHPDGGSAHHAVLQDPERYRECDGAFRAVRVSESGKHAFTLMERPPEADYRIACAEAHVKTGPFEAGQSIPAGARPVPFETDLEAGSTELWTWFDRADGTARGAYFVDGERLRPAGAEPDVSQTWEESAIARIEP